MHVTGETSFRNFRDFLHKTVKQDKPGKTLKTRVHKVFTKVSITFDVSMVNEIDLKVTRSETPCKHYKKTHVLVYSSTLISCSNTVLENFS